MAPEAGPGEASADADRELVVAFPAGRGVSWWAERNAGSPIPGIWPYGLDGLARPGFRLSAVEVGGPGPIGRITGSVLGPRRRWAKGADVERAAITWDEHTAGPMLATVSAGVMAAGVIWATDRVEAHENEPAMKKLREVLLQLDALWCNSRPQVEAVRSFLGPNSPPVFYFPFGVDPTFYRAATYPQAEPGEGLVVSVGGDRDRDAETLFAALEKVRQARPKARFVIQSKTKLTPPAGMEVHAFVPHDQVRKLMAEASVVAIATRPNLHISGLTVTLESMSVGRPVVVTETPGIDDYVVTDSNGYLVPVGDSDAMVERIVHLLDHPDTAAAMGLSGQSSVHRSFTTQTLCDRILDMLAQVGWSRTS